MASHKSAEKRARQTVVRTQRNILVKGEVKGAVRRFREALASSDMTAAKTSLNEATRELRKAATKGVVHKANASRRVGRLVSAFNRASAQG